MIKVLTKVDRILGILSDLGKASFTEIRESTGLNKATLSQILKSMAELGWVSRDAKGRFEPGLELISFAEKSLARESLRHAALEASKKLAVATGETASASTLIDGRRVRIAKVNGSNEIIVDDELSSSGKEGLTGTATGKLMLAFQTRTRRAELLARDRGAEPASAINEELDEIKILGYARLVSPGGQVLSVARGIFDKKGRIVAAIGVSAPVYSWSDEKESLCLVEISAAASFVEEIMNL